MASYVAHALAYFKEVYGNAKKIIIQASQPSPPPKPTGYIASCMAVMRSKLPGLYNNLEVYLYGIGTAILFYILVRLFSKHLIPRYQELRRSLRQAGLHQPMDPEVLADALAKRLRNFHGKSRTQCTEPCQPIDQAIDQECLANALVKRMKGCHAKYSIQCKSSCLTLEDIQPLLATLKDDLIGRVEAVKNSHSNPTVTKETVGTMIDAKLMHTHGQFVESINEHTNSIRNEITSTIRDSASPTHATQITETTIGNIVAQKLSDYHAQNKDSNPISSSAELQELETTKSDLKATEKKLRLAQKELSDLKNTGSEDERIRDELSLKDKELSDVKSENQRLSSTVSQAQSNQAAIAKLQKELNNIKSEKVSAEDCFRREQSVTSELRKQLELQDQKAAGGLEKALSEKKAAEEALSKTNSQAEAFETHTKTQVKEGKQRLETEKKANSVLQARLQDSDTALASSRNDVESLHKALEAAKAELSQYKAKKVAEAPSTDAKSVKAHDSTATTSQNGPQNELNELRATPVRPGQAQVTSATHAPTGAPEKPTEDRANTSGQRKTFSHEFTHDFRRGPKKESSMTQDAGPSKSDPKINPSQGGQLNQNPPQSEPLNPLLDSKWATPRPNAGPSTTTGIGKGGGNLHNSRGHGNRGLNESRYNMSRWLEDAMQERRPHDRGNNLAKDNGPNDNPRPQ